MNTKLLAAIGAILILDNVPARAWDYEGHRAVNQLALASLPPDFPAFVREPAIAERIAFLGGEPDRWRSVRDLPLRHVNGPDHYIDLEQLSDYGMTPEKLPLLRYDFVAQLARERAAHPAHFEPIDPEMNADHTRELVGLLPWTIVENCEKLKATFGYLKTFQRDGGTPEEIANSQANAIYVMGTMGHFVGDAAQPLHTTVSYNGWHGANPNGYTTNHTFHAWIDGGFLLKTGGVKMQALAPKIQPATSLAEANRADLLFRAVVAWIGEQNKMVEPLYQLEKAGKLSGEGDKGREGREFLDAQLVKGGQMLGNLWLTEWKEAPIDAYLERQLSQRANITFNFPAIPVMQILEMYERYAGEKVALDPALSPNGVVRVATEQPVTSKEAAKLIADALREQVHIAITRSADGKLTTAPSGASK